MGEIADMMLDGTMCQVCGEWLNDGEDGDGYPITCAGCLNDEQICRKCGCTDDDCGQCVEKTGQACHWVEDDLCSACVVKPKRKK